MIKICLWCTIILPVIGYVYGICTKNDAIFLFCFGAMTTIMILRVLSLFVRGRK